ncbi:MAG: right-handed parallel beta-helix repeat-containing protein [Clostridiales bacterium]|nr:right-handed parallel beta-helix repeat-containing protein [Clostridiales bacterium]
MKRKTKKMKWIALLMAAALVLTTTQSGLVAALAEGSEAAEEIADEGSSSDAADGSVADDSSQTEESSDTADTGVADAETSDVNGLPEDSEETGDDANSAFGENAAGSSAAEESQGMLTMLSSTSADDEAVAAGNVAKMTIGNGEAAYYATVQAAIDAITSEDAAVITMLADSSENITIYKRKAINVTITLDLNGFTLSAKDTSERVITIQPGFTSYTYYYSVNFILADSSSSGSGKLTGGAGGIAINGSATATNNGATINVTMTGGTITGNTATGGTNGYGGGVYVTYASFTMTGGAITGNTADTNSRGGGGIYTTTGSTLSLSNATISNNSAAGGNGGGIYCAAIISLTMSDCTVTGNNASIGGGVYVNNATTCTLSNTTVSGNTATTSNSYGGVYITGTTFSMSNCTVSNNTGTGLYIGNATATLTGSMISSNSYRGGEFASAAVTLTNMTVTSNGNDGLYVYVPSNASSTHMTASLSMTDGSVISGNGNYGIWVSAAKTGSTVSFTMSGGKISDNKNCGVYIASGSSSNTTTFTMTGGTISGNTATYGGGVRVNSNTSFTMSGGEISGNSATSTSYNQGGGGVYASGSFAMTGGTISGNTAVNGGGVCVVGGNTSSFTMSGGTISENTATVNGGGVYLTQSGTVAATLTLSGGTITKNSASGEGGAVYQYTKTSSGVSTTAVFNYTSGTVSYNTSAADSDTDGTNGTVTYDGNSAENHLTNHTVTTYSAKAATCEENGNIAYLYCSTCSEYFSDSKLVNQIDGDSVIIAAISHNYSIASPEWSEDGKTYSAELKCANDETHIVTVTLTTTANEYGVITPSVKEAATCTEKGTTTYTAEFTCNGQTFSESVDIVDIPALGHSWSNPVWSWSSDYSTATATFTCENLTSEIVTVEASVSSSTTPATTETEGSIIYYAIASFNGQDYTDKQVITIAQLPEETDTDSHVHVADTVSSVSAEGLTDEELEVAQTAGSSVTATDSTQIQTNAANLSAANTVVYADAAKDALNKAMVEITDDTTVTVVTEIYLKTDVKSISITDDNKTLVVEISMYYNVKATTDKSKMVESGYGQNTVTLSTGNKLERDEWDPINLSIDITGMGFTNLNSIYISHDSQYGVHNYKGNVTENEDGKLILTFTNPHGFSEFTITEDNRVAVVNYNASNSQQVTYTPEEIGEDLKSAAKDGYTFKGWSFEGIEGTYTTLTDDLLTALSDLYAQTGTAINATAVFTENAATATTTSTSSTTTTAAKTGDTNSMGWYLALIVIGVAGLAAAVVTRRKKRA